MSERGVVGKREFDKLLLEVVDEGLIGVLGESPSKAVYYHLEKNFSFRKEEVLQNPEAFAEGLEKLFGSGAQFLERAVLKKLYLKVGINFEERGDYAFVDYVEEARRTLSNRKTSSRTAPSLTPLEPASIFRGSGHG